MVAKSLSATAEDLADTSKAGLMTMGHDLRHAASAVENAAMQATARGSKALRRQAERMRGAAKDAGDQAASVARRHPYLSAATLLGSLVALAGIALLAKRSTSR